MWGHGAMFSFDPADPAALAAVREDVASMVGLWAAWVKEDWAGGAGKPLEGAWVLQRRIDGWLEHYVAREIVKHTRLATNISSTYPHTYVGTIQWGIHVHWRCFM